MCVASRQAAATAWLSEAPRAWEGLGCSPVAADGGLAAVLKFFATPTIAPMAAPAAGPTIGTGIPTAAPIAAPAAASLTMSFFAAALASVPASSFTRDAIPLALAAAIFPSSPSTLPSLFKSPTSTAAFFPADLVVAASRFPADLPFASALRPAFFKSTFFKSSIPSEFRQPVLHLPACSLSTTESERQCHRHRDGPEGE